MLLLLLLPLLLPLPLRLPPVPPLNRRFLAGAPEVSLAVKGALFPSH
jgi:hypothetical protein